MKYSEDILRQITEKASLVELISEYAQIKRIGKSYTCLCPFHSEKTPSFSINEEDGLYHCFGCGEKGNVFGFVMKTKSLSFPEAVKYLANRLGVLLPKTAEYGVEEQKSKRAVVFRKVMQAANQAYSDVLINSKMSKLAIEYLGNRGVSKEAIIAFSLGYAPSGWEFIERAVSKLISEQNQHLQQALLELGLIKKRSEERNIEDNKDSSCYDVLRGRIIFPITRSDSQVIAFGARKILPSDTSPKYLNSPESLLYAKRKCFYGLYQAMQFIRRDRHAYIVEGYFDVISMHERGLKNVLAACGTAVTDGHVITLKRLVDRLTLIFDGDAAGRKAAANCFPLFLNSGIDISVCILDEGEDPDSLARVHNDENFHKCLTKRKCSLVEVFLEHLIREKSSASEDGTALSSAAITGKVANDFVGVLRGVTNTVEKEMLLRQGAEILGVSYESLMSLKGDVKHNLRSSLTKAEFSGEVAKKMFKSAEYDDYDDAKIQSQEAYKQDIHLTNHHRQIVIALICEPSLAKHMFELCKSQLLNPSENMLPESVCSFVLDICSCEPRSLKDILIEAGDRAFSYNDFLEISDLFKKHSIAYQSLIDEALAQIKIGGSNPQKVINDFLRQSRFSSLEIEMQNIRGLESKASDSDSLELLIQEKLRKRRDLEELKKF